MARAVGLMSCHLPQGHCNFTGPPNTRKGPLPTHTREGAFLRCAGQLSVLSLVSVVAALLVAGVVRRVFRFVAR